MLSNILTGLSAYVDSIGLISKLRLWKYFAIPIIISLLSAICIVALAVLYADDLSDYINQILIGWDLPNWLRSVEIFVLGVVLVVLGLVVYKHIVMALSAPFMSPVSESIERHILAKDQLQVRESSFSKQLWRGIRINLRNLIKEILLSVLIIFLGFIPVVGILSAVLLFLVQAYYAGFGNMDYTLERHFEYKESIEFVKKRKGLAIGNGIVFMLFLLIPVIGVIFVMPLSVVAASKITVQELNA